MATYYYAAAFHNTKANIQSTNDISNVPAAGLAIGVGDEVAGDLNYALVNQITSAVHKLLNSARDRNYIRTAVDINHYAVTLSETKPQVADIATITNQNGHVSLYIGEDFHVAGAGTGADNGLSTFSSGIVDAVAKIVLNEFMDDFLNKGN